MDPLDDLDPKTRQMIRESRADTRRRALRGAVPVLRILTHEDANGVRRTRQRWSVVNFALAYHGEGASIKAARADFQSKEDRYRAAHR